MLEPTAETRFPTLEEKLDPAKTALLLVDVQNDFCHPDGFFPHVPAFALSERKLVNRMRDPLLALLTAARAADCLRVFIRAIYDPIYCAPPFAEKLNERGAFGHACLEGTWGADYWEPFRIRPSSREVEVIKHRNGAFHGTNLAVILRANGIRTTVITGVATSGCVDSTVRHAMFEDFFAIVPADTTADLVEERYRVHLGKLADGFATVTTSEEVIRVWERERMAA